MLFQITNSDIYALADKCKLLLNEFQEKKLAGGYPPDRADFETLIREWVKGLEFPTQLLGPEGDS